MPITRRNWSVPSERSRTRRSSSAKFGNSSKAAIALRNGDDMAQRGVTSANLKSFELERTAASVYTCCCRSYMSLRAHVHYTAIARAQRYIGQGFSGKKRSQVGPDGILHSCCQHVSHNNLRTTTAIASFKLAFSGEDMRGVLLATTRHPSRIPLRLIHPWHFLVIWAAVFDKSWIWRGVS